MTAETLIWLIPLPPLLAFGLIVLFTNRSKAVSHTIAIAGAAISWLLSMIIFVIAVGKQDLAEEPLVSAINWLPTGETFMRMGVQIDNLSAVVLFFVAWTILMIIIYSVGYQNFGQPKGERDVAGLPPRGAAIIDSHGHVHNVPSVEPMYSRFFAFLSLFAFAMYLMVVSDNLLLLYVGWEIMGLCSYLLIGFWYGKDSAKKAAMKAFMTTRIGDVFMLLGIAFLYSTTGTLNYREIFGNHELLQHLAGTPSGILGLSTAGAIGLLLFIGTIGKSALFPLHVWLPDAMEGPTPVSAMIHAATMVSAGVYLSIRIFPLLSAGWETGAVLTPVMIVVGAVGGFTALFAATIAVAQNDIKRVLAYSTISQLGYMIAAVGIGAYTAAIFHLVTHAFFKALLFLGSGSVIHGMEHGVLHTGEHVDAQDMLNMGGLRRKMPVTFWTFLIGGFALSGFPLVTAGFWSKDEILSGAFRGGQTLVFVVLAVAALLTAFYTMRQITLTFFGQPRTEAARHAQETSWTMTLPLVVLAVFAVGAGWSGIPEHFPVIGGILPNWFESFTGAMLGHEEQAAGFNAIPLVVSVLVSLGGLGLGWMVYRKVKVAQDPLRKALGGLHTLLRNKYYFDEIYQQCFINPATWFSEVFTSIWMDKVVIDGILHSIGRAFLWLGRLVRSGFDVPVVNRGGDAIAGGVKYTGAAISPMQSGRVQQYMVVTITVVMVFTAILFAFLKLV
ncbi:MAG: NADH-quinone oxidoreductase subunit L [Anaerolinea sp.]|nr:NADH-quinone oxidoreductase subunit L [Anaerolinea sp.]